MGERHIKHLRESGKWKEAVQACLAADSFADACVGHVLDALKKSPHKENTIVVLWGDHGYDVGEKKFAKYTDWKMPTRKQAMTIYDPSNPNTDVYGDTVYLPKAFPAGAGATTWTRTINKTYPALAMRFFYYNGDYKWHKRGLRSHGVRPVRIFKKQGN